MLEENTYLYLTSLPLLYLYLCWGKNNFPPFPSSISSFVFRRLIDQFFKIKYFVSFLPAGTLMFIRLLMYPVQMLSLMNLIFAEKQRITFFGPPASGLGKFFHPDWVMFCESLGPLGWALAEPVLSRWLSRNFFLNCLAHFYVVGTGSIFPHKFSFAVRNYFPSSWGVSEYAKL